MNNEMLSLEKSLKNNIQKLIDKGLIDEANELLNIYENINGLDVETYSIKAVIKILQNKFDEADSILKKAIELYPNDSTLMFNISYLKDKQNKYTEAIEYYCLGKLLNPKSRVMLADIITKIKPIDYNNLKVIHGTIEIANQMNTIRDGLKKIGIDVKTLNYYPNYLGYKDDEEFDITKFSDLNKANIETKKIAAKKIAENDIFHFHFGTSLTLDYTDLPLIKELGKKIIMQYWGSEVRLYSKAIKMNPYVKVKSYDEEMIKRKLALISQYSTSCIVDYELAEYVKEYHNNIYYTKIAINLDKYSLNNSIINNKILIVHAPTSPEVKGTKYILEAIRELKRKYDFEFMLVQNMSHDEAIEIYKRADLIIDQIILGAHGAFAVEAMAMGKAVICWISDFMKLKYPEELPLISANQENIKEKIEYLLLNRDLIKVHGEKGRAYVEKYHDMNKISQNILEIYKKL